MDSTSPLDRIPCRRKPGIADFPSCKIRDSGHDSHWEIVGNDSHVESVNGNDSVIIGILHALDVALQ